MLLFNFNLPVSSVGRSAALYNSFCPFPIPPPPPLRLLSLQCVQKSRKKSRSAPKDPLPAATPPKVVWMFVSCQETHCAKTRRWGPCRPLLSDLCLSCEAMVSKRTQLLISFNILEPYRYTLSQQPGFSLAPCRGFDERA